MNAVRELWTDERLDDLTKRVDHGFEQVDKRFEQVDKKFEQVDRRFEQVHASIDGLRSEMNERFDRLQLTLIAVGGTIAAALIASPHL